MKGSFFSHGLGQIIAFDGSSAVGNSALLLSEQKAIKGVFFNERVRSELYSSTFRIKSYDFFFLKSESGQIIVLMVRLLLGTLLF